MAAWWQRPWVRRHATVAPFGILAATTLLTFYLEQWQWQGRASWELSLSAVDYGAVLYAMMAVLVEKGGNLMFWAWEKHKERQAQTRARLRAEALAELLAAAHAEEKPVVEEVARRVAPGVTLSDQPQQ